MSGTESPEERLTSGGWRLINSWWVLLPLLSLGLLAWAGFLYVGVSARRRGWWIWAGVYAATMIAGVVVMPGDTTQGWKADLGTSLIVGTWVVATVHALVLNRAWLRHRASARPWYTQAEPAPSGWTAPGSPMAPPPPPPPPPSPASSLPGLLAEGVEPQRFYSEPPYTPLVVDLNTASANDLTALPGLTPARAQQIMQARQQRGGFVGLDDFATAAALAPHELAAIRELVRFSPFVPPAAGPSGRILDV